MPSPAPQRPPRLPPSPLEAARYCQQQGLIWHSINQWPAPRRLVILQQAPAVADALKLIRQGTSLLWEGDFHQGKQLLQSLKRRLPDPAPLSADSPMPESFHQLRMHKSQQARTLGQLLIRIEADWQLQHRRAPQIRDACLAAWSALDVQGPDGPLKLDTDGNLPAPLLVPLTQLQGILSAHQWQLQGVPINVLGHSIHPQYGVFAPTRQEYLPLLMQAPLPQQTRSAIDLGTGTGILAALLAQRGLDSVLAIDLHPAALACARRNIEQLGLNPQVQVQAGDLLQNAPRVDLIVCNPPWLPGAVRSPLDAAVYDPDSRMLRGFLTQASAHLNPGGQAWLIISDLAERLGLRSRAQLMEWITRAGFSVIDRLDTRPSHHKASRQSDPLAAWRSQEITSLWQLSWAGTA